LEGGKQRPTEEGTPQGASVSPLLANIYLHYVLDLWATWWRKKRARGEMIIVRYADDAVMGFQSRSDAERFRKELQQRFGKFNLRLNEDKTRLIEFGRFAAENRKRRGEGKPETFDFLGFTHICSRKQNGKFVVLRHTIRRRMWAKLRELKEELKQRQHSATPELGRWLQSVLRGYNGYFGVPRNGRALSTFRYHVTKLWFRTIQRRSQRSKINWERMKRLTKRWLPYPTIQHPYPEQRLRVTT